MNKYQEALDIIVEKTDMLNNTCLHLPKCMKNGICHYVGEGLCEDYERAKLLQELVDRETPMKVKILGHDEDWLIGLKIAFGECPKCKFHVCDDEFYCRNCGQRIFFEESDDND